MSEEVRVFRKGQKTNIQGPLYVVMTVYSGDADSDDVILNQRVYDFLDPAKRLVITNTQWWAMTNNHEFVLRVLDGDEEVEIIGHPTKVSKEDDE